MKDTRAVALALILLTFSPAGAGLLAQWQADPYAPPPVPLRGPAELEQLVGPIALYPDPLIAELLPAATRPPEVTMADSYLRQGADVTQVDLQPWDPSIKAMARYPATLRWMADNIAWTAELGQAFLYQQAGIMNAIQRLRSQALALGNLQSTPQQTVLTQNGIIEILPANPQVVYVPVYEPQVVYVQRPPRPGAFISFGIAWPIGVWLNHDFDWWRHDVIVWRHDHPRPPDWWRRPPDRRHYDLDRTPVRVWQPHARTGFSDHDRESRGWSAPPRIEHAGPRLEPGPNHRPDRVEERPAVRPREVERPRVEPRAVPGPAPAPRSWEALGPGGRSAAAGPGVTPAPRSSSGALIGVQSAPETRQYSTRGQQSRQEVKPAPAPAGSARRGGESDGHGERSRR